MAKDVEAQSRVSEPDQSEECSYWGAGYGIHVATSAYKEGNRMSDRGSCGRLATY